MGHTQLLPLSQVCSYGAGLFLSDFRIEEQKSINSTILLQLLPNRSGIILYIFIRWMFKLLANWWKVFSNNLVYKKPFIWRFHNLIIRKKKSILGWVQGAWTPFFILLIAHRPLEYFSFLYIVAFIFSYYNKAYNSYCKYVNFFW